MPEITAVTRGGLRVEASDGRYGAVMDEPPEVPGGTGTAMTPMRTLVASLGACTAMTLKLYSARKGWPLEDVEVVVRYEPPRPGGDPTHRFAQAVTLRGPLDEEQRARLLEIAGRCPVHRVLQGPCAFEETLVAPADA
jgi:putative redox protein